MTKQGRIDPQLFPSPLKRFCRRKFSCNYPVARKGKGKGIKKKKKRKGKGRERGEEKKRKDNKHRTTFNITIASI
jgi:hypothetical protein